MSSRAVRALARLPRGRARRALSWTGTEMRRQFRLISSSPCGHPRRSRRGCGRGCGGRCARGRSRSSAAMRCTTTRRAYKRPRYLSCERAAVISRRKRPLRRGR
jgi:hypothetical protein